MSIVEKAAERLKVQRPAVADTAPVEVEHARHESSIERLQAAVHAPDARASESPAADAGRLLHIDQPALCRNGLFPADEDAGWRLLDELRRIKRPLLDNVSGNGARVVLHPERITVTSALPNEGKTFTSVNLALSLARDPDYEVLLVDGDVPGSGITRLLGLEGKPGLMNVLADATCDPESVVLHTDVPNLMVVPSGTHNALRAELFGSQRMEYVLEAFERSHRQRLLLFDSPPLLAIQESPVLVSRMGQVVVVVAANRTRQQDVRDALECLDDAQYVGLVLNMSRTRASESRYYGYYGRYRDKGA